MYSRYPHGILVITRHQRVHNAEDYFGHEVGRQSLHSNFRHLPLLTFGRPEEGPVVGIQIVSDCHTLQVIHPSRYIHISINYVPYAAASANLPNVRPLCPFCSNAIQSL